MGKAKCCRIIEDCVVLTRIVTECICARLIKILAQMYAYFLVMNSKRCKSAQLMFVICLFVCLFVWLCHLSKGFSDMHNWAFQSGHKKVSVRNNHNCFVPLHFGEKLHAATSHNRKVFSIRPKRREFRERNRVEQNSSGKKIRKLRQTSD